MLSTHIQNINVSVLIIAIRKKEKWDLVGFSSFFIGNCRNWFNTDIILHDELHEWEVNGAFHHDELHGWEVNGAFHHDELYGWEANGAFHHDELYGWEANGAFLEISLVRN